MGCHASVARARAAHTKIIPRMCAAPWRHPRRVSLVPQSAGHAHAQHPRQRNCRIRCFPTLPIHSKAGKGPSLAADQRSACYARRHDTRTCYARHLGTLRGFAWLGVQLIQERGTVTLLAPELVNNPFASNLRQIRGADIAGAFAVTFGRSVQRVNDHALFIFAEFGKWIMHVRNPSYMVVGW